jgi:hypothetical protein
MTPQGIRRAGDVDPTESPSRSGTWIYVVLVGAALSIGLFFLGRYTGSRKQGGSTEAPEKSIAVLPFENLSRDPENAYFADGIQQEILTRLAKIANLRVISRTSTQKYKSAPENLRQIARQLGVTIQMTLLPGPDGMWRC